MAGTLGRVYGGDPNLIHVPDGQRTHIGYLLEAFLSGTMRQGAENRTDRERETQNLCPGCYMVVGFDMLVALADNNGQSRKELARSMRDAFQHLLDCPDDGCIEEIHIELDPC